MTMTRPQLWKTEVPGGWKIIGLRAQKSAAIHSYYLSPEGKRFASLEAVRDHISRAELSDAEIDVEDREVKKKQRKRKRRKSLASSEPVAKKLKFDDEEMNSEEGNSKDPLILPSEIQKKRKLMAANSQFRNLLKKTLTRNHHKRIQRKLSSLDDRTGNTGQTPGDSGKRPSQHLDVNTVKTAPPPPSKSQKTSDDVSSPERPGSVPPSHSTPPRAVPRPLFPPPSLTPPVVERRPRPSFTSPTVRGVHSREVSTSLTKPLQSDRSPLKAKQL